MAVGVSGYCPTMSAFAWSHGGMETGIDHMVEEWFWAAIFGFLWNTGRFNDEPAA